jgi:adenosine deaminase
MLTRELITRLPKAELHVHLDGCLRPETMIDLARTADISLPARDPDSLRKFMRVDDAKNLEDYLKRFDITIALLQTPEAVERVAYEMVEDAAKDNVRYLEVRYCPHLSRAGGMTLDEVIEAELRGFERGERDFGSIARVINCSLRHYDPALSVEIAAHSVKFRERGVVAFDLAGGEAGRPPGAHKASASRSMRVRPRGPTRLRRRCTSVMPTASDTAPGSGRTRRFSNTSATAGSWSRRISPATCRLGP